MRSLPEWIGKTDDTPVPRNVKVRVFERFGGRCYLSGRSIRPGDKWDVEHVKALCLGGENRESNLAPALVIPHRAKTKIDRRVKAKNDRVRKRFLGIKPKSKFLTSKDGPFKQKLNGRIERR